MREKPYASLWEALHYQDAVRFKQLLQAGADVHSVDAQGNGLLHMAVQQNCYEIVQCLLEDNIVSKGIDSKGNTLLHFAAQHADPRLTQLLLSYGINAYVRNANNQLPLHLAVQSGHTAVVKCLLNQHTIQARDEAGNTPLHLAVYHGHLELAKYLIKQGAHPNAVNKGWNTILHFAAYYNYIPFMKWLLNRGLNIKQRTKTENALALHIASLQGHLEAVKILIEAEISTINARTRDKSTALYLAASRNHKEIVEFLIKKGASINIQIQNGWTALHFAAYQGYLEVVDILLHYRAKCHIKTKLEKELPLHTAIRGGHIETVKFLLKNKTQINTKTAFQDTPLHLAAVGGNVAISDLLINKEVNLNEVNKFGNTALHLAAGYGHMPLVKYLIAQGAGLEVRNTRGGETPLHMAIQSGNFALVSFLLSKGAQPRAITQAGYTALHLAAMQGNEAIVLLLLEKNIPLYAKDRVFRNTALHWAAFYGHVHIVDILLTKGKPNDQLKEINALGRTALHLATLRENFEVYKFLTNKMLLNLNISDRYNMTPFYLALKYTSIITRPHIAAFALIRQMQFLKGQVHSLDNKTRHCFNGWSEEEHRALYASLKEFFIYHAIWEKNASSLRLNPRKLLVSQKGAIDFWMRCTLEEKKSLGWMAQSQYRSSDPCPDKGWGWWDLPLEIKQRIIYYSYQEKLYRSHPFQVYRSPSKWILAMGTLMSQLSCFSPKEVSKLILAYDQFETKSVADYAERQSKAMLSFYSASK
jgi:ankyrin repeat protein